MARQRVSTGRLPAPDEVRALVAEAHQRYRHLDEGTVADYIPALARVAPDLFGVCVAGVDGGVFAVGDGGHPFSVQSISKPFVFALVCQAIGVDEARRRLGVNSTGLPFDSVMAIELSPDRTTNAMVNAGAIATTSLVPGATATEKWRFVQDGLSRFAGRPLQLDADVYASEAATNLRNRSIAHLLEGYGRLFFDPDEATDVYTRQCSLTVTVEDLAVMGATLADGGVNPRTGERVVDAAVCPPVLAVLATAGLYERSGDWLYDVGLPGKSGVSGGIVTVSPGKGGLGTFSPRLDAAGNSVRGLAVTRHLSQELGLNVFASAVAGAPAADPDPAPTPAQSPCRGDHGWGGASLRSAGSIDL
jgi:glutaminase